ncbi:MAG: PIN domain-containing protein [Candidatus Woesearchaeota archaeon]
MEVAVDTNALMSALIKPSKSRELICSPKLVLHAPEHIISESLAHKQEIISKSGINKYEFSMLTTLLLSRINIVPEDEFRKFIRLALKLVSHPEDAPFIALSLSKNIPLWSDDKALKEQSSVKVFTTAELIKEIGL